MASSAILDSFLNLVDQHIQLHTGTTQSGVDHAVATSDPASRLKPLRSLASSPAAGALAQPAPSSSDAAAALTPLERALLHEVQYRRNQLEARQQDVEFWEHYYNGARASDSQIKLNNLADDQLDEQIRKRKQQLKERQKGDWLRREIATSVENGITILSTMSNTTPTQPQVDLAKQDRTTLDEAVTNAATAESTTYKTTRQLLDERDDKALEFLRVFEQLNQIRDKRFEVKAEILRAREETSKLLSGIKATRADLTLQRIQTQSQPRSGPERTQSSSGASTQDAGMASKIQRAQAALVETQAKKEMVKGVLRGLILESGRDWTQNKATRELLLSLEDEEPDSEDEFVEDEEGEGEGGDEDEAEEDRNDNDDDDE